MSLGNDDLWNDQAGSWRSGGPDWASSAPDQPSARVVGISGLSIALMCLLWLSVALSSVQIVDSLASLAWLSRYDTRGLDFLYSQPQTWEAVSALLAVVSAILLVATMVVWLVWQYLATRNVLAWGVLMRRGKGWAIGAWFTPIVWWWFPAQCVHDLLRGSKPGLPSNTSADREDSEPLIPWWWAAFLLSNATGQVAGRLFLGAEDNGTWAWAFSADLVDQSLNIAAAVLAIRVVTGVSGRQRLRGA